MIDSLLKIGKEEPIRKLTKEERLLIQQEIASLEMKQYAIKIIINSIYGAFGNKFFYFHNNDIAQSITIQGQDLIKFSIKAINHYFINKWHLDTVLHEALGILGKKIIPITTEASIYADTDSTYVNFQLAFDSIVDWEPANDDAKILFCEKIIKHTFAEYLKKAFGKYAIAFNTENKMAFKLENISSSGIWVAKKSYVLRVKFDRYLLDKGELLAKGIDYAKPTFPKWARDKMEGFINLFLDKGRTVFHEEDIIPLLMQCKKEMQLCNIDDIAFNYNVTKYNEYIESIYPLVLRKGTPIRARAAAYHNSLIEQTGIRKYNRIRQGNKVKFYFAKYPIIKNDSPEEIARKAEMNVYGFIGSDYPIEFGIPVDYDKQFFMILVEPINKLLHAMGLSTLDINLRREIKRVLPKSKTKVYTAEELLPLHAINNITLEHIEIPNKYAKYILDSTKPLPIDKTVLNDYVSYITKYKNDTTIIAEPELNKFITSKKKAIAKKLYVSNLLTLPPNVLEMFIAGIEDIKRHGFKQGIDLVNGEPTFTRNKTKKEYTLTFSNVLKIQTVDQYVGILKLIFKEELAIEQETLNKKLQREAKKKPSDTEDTVTVTAKVVKPYDYMNTLLESVDKDEYADDNKLTNELADESEDEDEREPEFESDRIE